MFLLLSFPAHTQKLNTKDFGVEAWYQEMPTKPLDITYTTYDVTANGTVQDLNRLGYTLTDIKEDIKLEGYNRVNGGGSISINVTVGTPYAGAATLSTEDKSDKEGHKWKEYSYYHDLSVASSYKITDYKGAVIEEKALPATDRIATSAYKSMEELKTAYQKAYPAALTDKLKSLLRENVKAVQSSINLSYGFSPRVQNQEIMTLQDKNHPDFAKYESMHEKVEAAFKALKAHDNTEYATIMQPVMDFWTAEEKKYSPANKDEQKMNYGLRWNLAIANLWKDDYDQSAAWFTKISTGEVKDKSGQRGLEEIAAVKAKLKKANRTSQHTHMVASEEETKRAAQFSSQLDDIYASGDVSKFEDFPVKVGLTSASKVEPAVMYYRNGMKENGYLVYESSTVTPDFRNPKNIRFGKAVGRTTVATSMDYAMLDSIHLKGNMFRIKTVVMKAGVMNLKLEDAIVETIVDYNRSAVMVIHPPFYRAKGLMSGADELTPEVVMYDKASGEYRYTHGLLGFIKPMSNNVEDCQPAVAYVESTKGQKDLVPADDRLKPYANAGFIVETLRIYDECK
jgi:hypothetical protein